jgi:hypothetical protein
LLVVEGSLAEKFAIEGPELEWEKDQPKFRLEFTVHNSITPELVHYEIYDYDCKKVAGDQPLELTLVDSVKDADDASSTTKTMSLSVELKADEYQTSSLYQKASLLHNAHLKACIRFMLWNIPKDNQHSMEVNFEQTQVDLTLSKEGTIQAMDKSALEKVGISVIVAGQQGAGKVVKPPNEEL